MSPERRVSYQELSAEQAVEQLFGLTTAELASVALQCWAAFTTVGPLKPKGFSGTNAWADGTEALRGILIPKGWMPSDPQNQPRIVSPDGKHALTVISGDTNTGNPHADPETRNKRGSQTLRSVTYNSAQMDLFPVSNVVKVPLDIGSTPGQTLWIFLFYVDTAAQEVRYELSRPVNYGDNEKVDGWEPRFIMPPLNFRKPEIGTSPDDGMDFDIPVKPRP